MHVGLELLEVFGEVVLLAGELLGLLARAVAAFGAVGLAQLVAKIPLLLFKLLRLADESVHLFACLLLAHTGHQVASFLQTLRGAAGVGAALLLLLGIRLAHIAQGLLQPVDGAPHGIGLLSALALLRGHALAGLP